MPDHGFIGRNRRRRLTKNRAQAKRFHFVILRRAGAMGIHIANIGWQQAGIGQRILHGANDGRPIRVGPRAVEIIRPFTAATDKANNRGATRAGMFQIFQNQRRRAFAHHETVAGFLKGARCFGWVFIAG